MANTAEVLANADRGPAPAPRMSKEDRVKAIRAAAVAFANDYGPLAAANRGDEEAAHMVALKLFHSLRRNGLTIIQR